MNTIEESNRDGVDRETVENKSGKWSGNEIDKEVDEYI